MKSLSVIMLALLLLLAGAPAAGAAPTAVTFGDTRHNWPGWENGSSDDRSDTIGIPDFTGGAATFDSGRLTQLSFTVNDPFTPPSWNCSLQPGDLFIDFGADNRWDFVVDLTTPSTWTVAGKNGLAVGAGDYEIYAVDIPLGGPQANPGYSLSGRDNAVGSAGQDWRGFLIRDNHPVAWGEDLSGPVVHFSGWGSSPSFDFSGLPGGGLELTSASMSIGWTVDCANDVVYEQIHVAPEPSTWLLLGSGLGGLAVWIGRKKS